jgi:hypothetical protein
MLKIASFVGKGFNTSQVIQRDGEAIERRRVLAGIRGT